MKNTTTFLFALFTLLLNSQNINGQTLYQNDDLVNTIPLLDDTVFEKFSDAKEDVTNNYNTESFAVKDVNTDSENKEAVTTPLTDANIKTAVNAWVANPTTATATYGHISNWDVSAVTDMSNLFNGKTTFNDDITGWDVSNVTNMQRTFSSAYKFNQDISGWDVSNVTNMFGTFQAATDFNQNIGTWDVSSVTNMNSMFTGATNFNQNIGSWDVSKVTNMSQMFANVSGFNQDIGSWDVSNVHNMSAMFYYTSFNQDIGSWDVSKVTTMNGMFSGATNFNQPIGNWETHSLSNIRGMFNGATSFNQDIGRWDVVLVNDMGYAFDSATSFNQDLSNWCAVNFSSEPERFAYSTALQTSNKPVWGTCSITGFDATNIRVSTANLSSEIAVTETVLEKGFVVAPNVSNLNLVIDGTDVIKVNAGSGSGAYSAIVSGLTESLNYNFRPYAITALGTKYGKLRGFKTTTPITDENIQGAISGIYSTNDYTRITAKITYGAISDWDVSNVTNMSSLFSSKVVSDDISGWDVSNVKNMDQMFLSSSFNQDISSWNVSKVTHMRKMFSKCSFNQDIGGWDVSNVTHMSEMFSQSYYFNQDISSWDVGNVLFMNNMFVSAFAFNQDISSWNVSNVSNMTNMFYNTYAMNYDLSSWCVSQIASEPTGFATNSALQSSNFPVWGTCPVVITPPTITTTAAATITTTSADLAGDITAGSETITERGIVYAVTATNANPEIGGTGVTKDDNVAGAGVFTETITGLTASTGYSYRAYATTATGTTYGAVLTFSTLALATPATTLNFDGTDDYVTIGSVLPSNASYTKEAWIYLDQNKDAHNIISSLNSPFYILNSQLYVTNNFGASGIYLSSPNTIALNTWIHVAVSWDGTTMKIFENGIEVTSATGHSAYTSGDITIGKFLDGNPENALGGNIDEVRIWNTVRTCAEIAAYKDVELAGNESGLVAYYDFNQGVLNGNNTAETVLLDKQTNGTLHNGTLTNFTLTGTSSNWVDGSANGVTTGSPTTFPEINIVGNSVNILDGDITPDAADDTEFGDVSIATDDTHTFTIQNTGSGDLIGINITKSGTHQGEFVVAGAPATVAAGQSATFTVTFTPANADLRTVDLTINSNDCDEAAYTIKLQGTGVVITSPSVTTVSVDNTSEISFATFSGDITSDGGASLTAMGVVFSENSVNANPEIGGTGVQSRTKTPTQTGAFTLRAGTFMEGVSYSYRIYASNSEGTTYGNVLTFITLTPPTFTSTSTASFTENTDGIAYTAAATDNNSITYSLGVNADESLFTVDANTGVVRFVTAPNFEIPSDSDTNNTYVIEVIASDGNASSSQTVTITVTDAFEDVISVQYPTNGLIGHWIFEGRSQNEAIKDITGNWDDLTFEGAGSTSVISAGLDLNANGYAQARGFKGETINSKTLITYVSLQDLGVTAGSAITLDDQVVDNFDAIVFSEQAAYPNQWRAGSSNFSRSTTTEVGVLETQANQQVQIAVTYNVISPTSMEITMYRNGVLVGSYTDDETSSWPPATAEMLFGVRHTLIPNANGNPGFEARGSLDAVISRAMIYNRALSAAEVASITGIIDTTPPTVVISTTSDNPTNSNPIPVQIVFSEAVVGFTVNDITVSGATLSDFATADNLTFTVNAVPTVDGTVSVSVAGAATADAAGVGNTASNTLEIGFDATAPTFTSATAVDFTENASGVAYTIAATDAAAITYSLGSGNDESAFTINGAEVSFVSSPDFETKASYTINVVATDAGSNAANQDVVITILDVDEVAPTVVISSSVTGPTNTNPIPVTITFIENVTGFDSSDVSVSGGTIQNFSGSNASYSFNLVPSGNGTLTVDIAADVAQDGAGNNNTVATQFTIEYANTPATALSFDGTDDYVDIGQVIPSNSSYTKEAWVYLENNTGNIISTANAPFWIVNGALKSTNNLLNVGGVIDITSPNTLAINTWIHVAVTYDGSTMKLYEDGVLAAEQTGVTAYISENINIGSHGGGATPLGANIDEVRIWNTARTCDEISAYKDIELTGTETGLIAYYDFNQGFVNANNTAETALSDKQTNGTLHNGTLTNFTLTGTSSNWVDGTSNGVTTSSPEIFPEINIVGNSVNIVDGDITPDVADDTDFGSVIVSEDDTHTFTIQNTGTADLTGITIGKTGIHQGEFTINGAPTAITAGQSATFTVTFAPANGGLRTVDLTVNSNDCDEDTYFFKLQGTGTVITTDVTTTAAASISATTADLAGEVTSNITVTERGIVYALTATDADPEIGDAGVTKEISGTGVGTFSETISSLIAITSYSYKAYAITSAGTTYGNVLTFTTLTNLPTVTTAAAASIVATSASVGGSVSSTFETVTEKGIVYAPTTTNANPEIGNSGVTKNDNSAGTGTFTQTIANLTPNTSYSFRAYAITESGTTYGNVLTFSTPTSSPIVLTSVASNINFTTATIGGTISSNGGVSVTERGVLYAPTTIDANPEIGDANVVKIVNATASTGAFSESLTGLTAGTQYSFRIYAINSQGTSYGQVFTFTTISAILETTDASNITTTSAMFAGEITNTGGNSFTEKGVVYSITGINNNPVIGGTGVQKQELTYENDSYFLGTVVDLNVNSGYSYKTYATGNNGTTYGPLKTLTTQSTYLDKRIGYWDFEGGSTSDSAGNFGDLIMNGSTISNGKLDLNAGSNVRTANYSGSDITSKTLVSFAEIEDLDVRAGSILSIQSFETGHNFDAIVYSEQQIKRWMPGSEGFIRTETPSPGFEESTPNIPVMMVITYAETPNGKTLITIYRNGTEIGQYLKSDIITYSTASLDADSNTDVEIMFGSRHSIPSNRNFAVGSVDALVDEAMIFNRTLSPAEINALYVGAVEKATVTTTAASSISIMSAVLGGNVTSDGKANVTERGIVYSESNANSLPEIDGNEVTKVTSGIGTGIFSETVSNLSGGTEYSFRTYAINSQGTSYGNVLTFTTSNPSAPTVTTNTVSSVTAFEAVFSSNVTNNGGADIEDVGILLAETSVNSDPVVTDTNIIKVGTEDVTTFSETIKNLKPNTQYTYKAYADNDTEFGYGTALTFTTLATTGTVTTSVASSIDETSAVFSGEATKDGGASITETGIVYAVTATNANPEIGGTGVVKNSNGTALGTFSETISGLTNGTQYSYRAYVTNAEGNAYGEVKTFTTIETPPAGVATITTTTAQVVTQNSAIIAGNVSSDNGSAVTTRGIVFAKTSVSTLPTIGDTGIFDVTVGSGTGAFNTTATALEASTSYTYRAYAINGVGTTYGDVATFTTSALASFIPSGLIGHWDFENGSLSDKTGNWSDLTLNTNTSVVDGKLDLNPGSLAKTTTYSGSTIKEKTLVSYVELQSLSARAGSVLTIDGQGTTDNFDAIVFAERQVNRWMAGSSYFRRTINPTPGFAESTTGEQVMMAITYKETSNGQASIKIYRNGIEIGRYTKGAIATWASGNVEVLFGARHTLPSLRGSVDALVDEAMIFNRPLSESEILALYQNSINTTLVTTTSVHSIGNVAAVFGGNVLNDAGDEITDRGIIYAEKATNANPEIGGSGVTKVQVGTGKGVFGEKITDFMSSTTYTYRAYAINSKGTVYGEVEEFTTLDIACAITPDYSSVNQQAWRYFHGQYFVAPCDGVILSLSLRSSRANPDIGIRIAEQIPGYDREIGFVDNLALSDNSADVNSRSVLDLSSAAVNVEQGKVYYFYFRSLAESEPIYFTDDNSYSPRGSILNGYLHDGGNRDLVFEMEFGPKQEATDDITTFTAGATNSFADARNWDKGKPGENASIAVKNGVVMTVDQNDVELADFRLNEGATLNIPEDKEVIVNGEFNTDGSLSLDSNGDDSGVLFIKGTTSGTVTYKRGGLLANKWSVISAPVSGQKVVEFAQNTDNDIRTNTSVSPVRFAIGYYDDSQASKWNYFNANTPVADTFEIGKSYSMSRATDGEVTFVGTLEVGNVNQSVNVGEWQAIGNPYTTYLAANKNESSSFLEDNFALLDDNFPALYIWDNAQSKYVAVTQIDAANRSIPPGQGFFIRTKSSANVVFNQNKRQLKPTEGNATFNKSSNPEIILYVSDDASKVKTNIKYFANATKGFDAGYDFGNFGSSNLDIYSHLVEGSVGVDYTIQSLSLNDIENVSIPIGLTAKKGKEITFSLNKTDLREDLNIYLEDKLLNTLTSLKNSDDSYTITISENTNGIGRFYLRTSTKSLNNDDFSIDENISMYTTTNNTLKIVGLPTGDKASIILFNVLGKEIETFKIDSAEIQNTINLSNFSAGVYFVNLKSNKTTVSKKIIIK